MKKLRLPIVAYRLINLLVLPFSIIYGLGSAAHAGSYSVKYSGGQTTITGSLAKSKTEPYGGTTSWNGGCDTVLLFPIGSAATVTCSGQITATFTWVPNPNIPNDQPPPSVVVGQACTVTPSSTTEFDYNEIEYPNTTVSNNGLGGVPILLTTISNPGTSFTVNCSPSINYTATGGVPDGTNFSLDVELDVTYSAWIDTREVFIGSDLGLTYHSSSPGGGQGTPVADVAVGNTVNANTVLPPLTYQSPDEGPLYGEENISYNAVPEGNWTASSQYLWNLEVGEPVGLESSNGTFTLPNDPPLDYTGLYTDGTPEVGDANVSAGTQEHAYVHLTDAGDGANATATYYLTFHNPVENWVQASKTEIAPASLGSSPGGTNAGQPVTYNVGPDSVGWAVLGDDAGGACTTGAVVVTVLAPETDPAVILLLTTAGYQLGIGPYPPPTPETETGGENQFGNDVNTQEEANGGGIEPPFGDLLSWTWVDQTTLSDAERDGVNAVWTGSDGTLTYTVASYDHRWQRFWAGDGYNTTGYYGAAPGTTYTPGSEEHLFSWTVGAVAPPQ